jgi:hypothetical protein
LIPMPILTLRMVDSAIAGTPWNLGNGVLYKLCRDHPSHATVGEIVSKVWLIGRAYAAAVERRKKTQDNIETNEEFYLHILAGKIQRSKIDVHLSKLKSGKISNNKNIDQVLLLHGYLTSLLKKVTRLNKRSFSSKYLHFHRPELFFIYDSRAVWALNQFSIILTNEETQHIQFIAKMDRPYFVFFLKCLKLKRLIKTKFKKELLPREIDNLLLSIASNKPK